MTNIEYKYDIAISLCKEDIEFAREFVKQINPSLNVFFYEEKQKELITKSAPEEFAKVFKEDCRVVVILSREKWSQTYYTEIERNAIIDRTSVKNEGYNFLVVIPMEKGSVPKWYPSTRIYIDPTQYSIEQIASFIEYKVTDTGGQIKTVSLEERAEHLKNKMKSRRVLVLLQESEAAIQCAREQFKVAKEHFLQRVEYFKKSEYSPYEYTPFNRNGIACFDMGKHGFELKLVMPEELHYRVFSTQDFALVLSIYEYKDTFKEDRKKLESEERLFYYSGTQQGWAAPIEVKSPGYEEELLLFRHRDATLKYDLKDPVKSEGIIDIWFQKLVDYATNRIKDII